jgi:homoisocitrate dehydrogenase
LIVRENTEGLYAGRERLEGDTAIAERIITRKGSTRIVRIAFEQARKRMQHSEPRIAHSVTVVHKANVLKVTDGLFRECALQVAQEYPEIAAKEMLVDVMAMRLVRDPENFDVIVTTNLFGDILSDEASALIGGVGESRPLPTSERRLPYSSRCTVPRRTSPGRVWRIQSERYCRRRYCSIT